MIVVLRLPYDLMTVILLSKFGTIFTRYAVMMSSQALYLN
jgi:hypothetical protein